MKTFIIDLDSISSELSRGIIGHALSNGLPFRKLDASTSGKVGQALFVELASKTQETALKAFLSSLGVASPIVIDNAGKAKIDAKKLGSFIQVNDVSQLTSFYLDKSSGKKFTISGGV